MSFPSFIQAEQMDCGPTCLRIIAKHYGKDLFIAELRRLTQTTRSGASMLGLSEAAEQIGFSTTGLTCTFDDLAKEIRLPCIAHWNQSHYVVIYKVKSGRVYLSDPSFGLVDFNKEEFMKCWGGDNMKGTLLMLEPTSYFYDQDKNPFLYSRTKYSLSFLSTYVLKYKRLIVQLMFGLAGASILQLIFPLLAQAIVDVGIRKKDINFIYLVLLGQLMLFFGRTTLEIIRGWILIHISSRINMALVSDFFVKLMKLPISYFDVKMTGDIMQRINDHSRIENFLTSSALNTIFSLFNLLIFGVVLAIYSSKIFFVFLIGTVFYFGWVLFFLKRRGKLDYKRFQQVGRNQSKVIELINGMQEIKLHNAEKVKRWQWENIQATLFNLSVRSLVLNQTQNSGSALINELKNIIITFISAHLVITGDITLGMMLSISYIIGQLNSPVLELISFTRQFQDAQLSIERLAEIHNKSDEEPEGKQFVNLNTLHLPLQLEMVSFKYEGSGNSDILSNLTIEIPAKKITAIVGPSGSGKTTLMKLLTKFYEPTTGEIRIGDHNLADISPSSWRSRCGVVMQEGFIFSDSIMNNIAVDEVSADLNRIRQAAMIANIHEFISGLPQDYYTKIGIEGMGLSTGQKQRILIARAVYKNPDYLFFDEATSALDATNEKIISNNLKEFLKNKTVVIIAHRLSTVKNADQIIVLDKGQVIESANHSKLTAKRGAYYNLVKDQLELGS